MDNDKIPSIHDDTATRGLLDTGAALAAPTLNPHKDGRAYAIVPDGYKLEYIERPHDPSRHSGSVSFDDAASFIRYYQDMSLSGRIYASLKGRTLVAILNDHEPDGPGWRDFRATLALAHSKEWLEWTIHDRKDFGGNDHFAMWLEDNAPDMSEPSPAAMMDIAINMRVTQAQGFSKAVRLQDGNVRFTYSNDVSGSAGDLAIPEIFKICIPVFEGLGADRYTMDARFRYRLVNGELKVRYELVRPHKVVELAFDKTIRLIEKETQQKIFFGTP